LHHRTIRSESFDPDGEFAVLGEFACIAQDVEKALLHFGAVCAHATNVIRQAQLKRVAILGHQRRNDRLHLVDKRRNIDFLNEHVHLAGLDLREVENVIDQTQQMTAGSFDFLRSGTSCSWPLSAASS